jgi:hypothetical protein
MDFLMSLWMFVIGCILGIFLGVILSYRTAVSPLQYKITTLIDQDKRYHEKMKYYPYELERFRILGTPVDGVQFEEDGIIFVLFKDTNVPLTKEQEHLKTLLENGKVHWFEF